MDTSLFDTMLQVAEAKKLAQPEQELTNEKLDLLLRLISEQNKAIKTLSDKITPDVRVTNFPDLPEHDNTDVVQALARVQHILEQDNDQAEIAKLQAILEALTALPARMPKDNDSVEVRNLEQLKTAIETGNQQLLEAIKAIKVAPKITVPEPSVTVQPTDTKSVVKAIETVKRAVDTKVIPVANVPTDPLIMYTPADIDDSGAVQYFGFIKVDGSWYIRKYDTSVSPKTMRFAFGSSNYQSNFANRTSLTYNLWSQ